MTSTFQPIAITGRACLLPGAHEPAALHRLAAEGRCVLRDAPAGRWRVPDAHVVTHDPADATDHTWTRRGGYVEGFEPPAELAGLDPLTQWLIETARRALADAGADPKGMGAVVGNLSLPSSGSARFAEQVWLGDAARAAGLPPTDPRDAFNSGLPAHALASALGLDSGAFALDAACASSLYAIELACRELQEGRAERMLAGAVNRADDLFLHVGFCALGAMSKTGQSRPFHAGADGLVAGDGCGFVVLERIEDARRAGRPIHGVIRGVGLANDGRAKNLLAPSARGQERSMRLALEQAGLGPEEVAYIECHATGTPVGDATELTSMAAVYGDKPRPIGSLKGNLGHLITAAGVAGLIKVLESLRTRQLLPTPHLAGGERNPALSGSPFETLDRAEPWRGPRRAGLSAFGFGGNDAHLIVESADETPEPIQVAVPASLAEPIVAVALGARFGAGQSAGDFERVVLDGAEPGRAETVRIPLDALRFPPNDLKKASAQQTMILAAAIEACGGRALPLERTGVFVGYQCDPAIARWGARWRARSLAEALGADDDWSRAAEDVFAPPLEAPHVVGSLPNIPANRISSQLDLQGPSFTTAAEELSGLRALEVAAAALRRGAIDAALVGAVDRPSEVHSAALAALGASAGPVTDAAFVLLLRRRADALADGDTILATIEPATDATEGVEPLAPGLPRAHAAAGFAELCRALVCVARGRLPDGSAWPDTERALRVDAHALGDQHTAITVRAEGSPLPPFAEAPDVRALELPAQPSPVRLPPLPRAALQTPPTFENPMQKMAPPPPLPPTTDDGPPAPPVSGAAMRAALGLGLEPAPAAPAATAPVAPPAPATIHAATVHAAPVAAAPSDVPAGSLLAAFTANQMKLAEAHQAFIAQQSAVHRQFMGTLSAPALPARGSRTAPQPIVESPRHAVIAKQAPSPRSEVRAPSPPSEVRAPSPPSEVRAPSPPSEVRAPSPPSEVRAPSPRSKRAAEVPLAFRPRGPSFDREALIVHAGGTISEIFGELFRQQDGHAVQVRMPEPPLLLADRCTGIDAEAGAMTIPGNPAKGICWTETDVRPDSWYLHDGYMPTGIMVESGQADLFLISYLGADFLNRGERAYRLLGCEMTWLGDLPTIGESLVYDIHVDGHAAQGDVRLFFFHYDCHVRRADGTTRPALQVRNGQAGFFTEGELDDSAGILWRPETQDIRADARVDRPALPLERTAFDREAIEAFADGRPWDCFGDAFERTKTHTRTPRIQGERMLFLDSITLDPEGGPWGRGYLKAVTPISPDDWFFEGHFKNDPCMPGTLMLEGCVQAMAFYLSAMGYTVDKDGWRFQPIPDETYNLRCRGQVTPTSQTLTYEIFVEEVHGGPEPKLYADLLCTVDGLGAFHARRFGLQLTPSWPLTSRPELVSDGKGDERAAIGVYEGQEFRFDPPSLVACAWGQPSTAFGPMYERFDGTRRTPRLPGPPYLFLTRVTKVDGAMGGLESGKRLEFEYEIPPDAWYFDENGARVMPFAVLLEAALQPCGWTASYVGSTLTSESDFLFRNLDGKGTILAEVFAAGADGTPGTLRTVVDIKGISRSSGMIITSFHVQCFLGEGEDAQPVYDLETVFGFFPPEAFEDQAGLPTTDEQRALLELRANATVDLTERPARFCEGSLRLAEPMLLMIDRLTLLDPEGGRAGLGRCRAEKDVAAGEWFFKAHFYQDPVQPGSLGIEAMLQLLQAFMIDKGLGEGFDRPRFEAIATNREHVWKYRGQVVPEAKLVATTLEITAIERDERGVLALADASLWVDGKRIYEARDLGMRIVEEGEGERPRHDDTIEELCLEANPWLGEHRPTHTAPALPMMSMVDRMMAAARAADPTLDGLHDLRVERWVVVDPSARLKTEIEGDEVRLMVWREAKTAALSRFEVAARAKLGPTELEPLRALGPTEEVDPYAADRLFHGPAFHLVEALSMGADGSSAILDAGAGGVPFGTLHQGLLDAATHGIPHDQLHRWSDRISDDVVAYPHALDVRFDGPAPTEGEVRCEARFAGFEDDDARKPVTRLQLLVGDRVFADMRLVEILMPKGPLGLAEPGARRRFLREREPAPVGLATTADGVTTLAPADVALSNWFPGTIEAVYGTADPRSIAVQEHVARKTGAHPFDVAPRTDSAVDAHTPLTAHPVLAEVQGERVVVRDAGEPVMDLSPVATFWREHFGIGSWPVEDLYYALVERFVGDFHVTCPRAMAALEGQAVLYLGNHQVGIESLIFSIVASALQKVPTLTLAKVEHRQSWLGKLITHCFTYPGIEDPGVITYFDRADPSSLPRIAKGLAEHAATGEGARSLMVHVEGTRAHSARHRVTKMSGVFCDLAIAAGVPIVPVRFSGGLPTEPVTEKLEYPVGMGRQDYWLGAPILPAELASLPYKERTERVVAAIGALGPDPDEETPLAPDPRFAAEVDARAARTGAGRGLATLVEVLHARDALSDEARALLRAIEEPAPSSSDPKALWTEGLAAMLRGS